MKPIFTNANYFIVDGNFTDGAWLGGKRDKSGQFIWEGLETGILDHNSPLWGNGEPSSPHSHCLSTWTAVGHKLNDNGCGASLSFMCENISN